TPGPPLISVTERSAPEGLLSVTILEPTPKFKNKNGTYRPRGGGPVITRVRQETNEGGVSARADCNPILVGGDIAASRQAHCRHRPSREKTSRPAAAGGYR